MNNLKYSVRPSDNDPNRWWKAGLALFSEVTGWIVVPLIAALYCGRWLDEQYGTGDIYFFVLTGVAFILSCIGIGIVGARYIRQMEHQTKDIKNHDRH